MYVTGIPAPVSRLDPGRELLKIRYEGRKT